MRTLGRCGIIMKAKEVGNYRQTSQLRMRLPTQTFSFSFQVAFESKNCLKPLFSVSYFASSEVSLAFPIAVRIVFFKFKNRKVERVNFSADIFNNGQNGVF